MASVILIKHHLPLQVAKLSLFRNQMQEENGLHLVQVDGILGLIWSNTYATMQMRTKQDLNKCFYRIFIPTTHKIPFMSSDDRAYLVDAYLGDYYYILNLKHYLHTLRSPVGRPKTTYNPVSSLHEQTWCTSKGGTETTRTKFRRSSTTKCGHSCNI